MAPTIRDKPQCTKETKTLTNVTVNTADFALFGIDAIRLIQPLTKGALATQEPVMTIKAICMEKPSNSQNPLYQF